MSAAWVCDGCELADTDRRRVETSWWHLAVPETTCRRSTPDAMVGRSRVIPAQFHFCSVRCLVRWAATHQAHLDGEWHALTDDLEDEMYDELTAPSGRRLFRPRLRGDR